MKQENKEYSYKIYELKNGSRRSKILRDEYTAASNKKEAFQEAKNALFRLAKFEFEANCIKEEFREFYLQALKNKDFEALQDLEDKHDIYDYDRITGIDDDLTEAQFTKGDTSYCSSRDSSVVYLKVFSTKIKKFVVPKP
jgi:hypothetical protein